MAATLANEIRAAATMPAYCSACFNQDSRKVHVDFDAACDRGFGDDITVNMDDLVLCEDCVRQGALLVGMRDVAEVAQELETLRRDSIRNLRRAERAERYYLDLEKALRERPDRVPVAQRAGRPREVRDRVENADTAAG
jgi:hypothetical protein